MLVGAVRRAIAYGETLTLVLLELSVHGQAGTGVFRRPERTRGRRALTRACPASTTYLRGRGTLSSPGSFPAPTCTAASAPRRARGQRLRPSRGSELTAGICDLGTAGDPLGLCAFADRALIDARQQGLGGTAQYRPAAAA